MKLEKLSEYATKKITHDQYVQRFLYFLIRDYVPTTVIAECVNQIALTKDKEVDFCNDHLAAMAYDYAERLLNAQPTMGVDKGFMKLDDFNKKEKRNIINIDLGNVAPSDVELVIREAIENLKKGV